MSQVAPIHVIDAPVGGCGWRWPRKSKLAFHKADRSDLEGIYLEAQPGVDPAMVRIIKPSGTTFTLGCN